MENLELKILTYKIGENNVDIYCDRIEVYGGLNEYTIRIDELEFILAKHKEAFKEIEL